MIFCIVGRTSSGKDTLARELSQTLNIPIVVSYTTRPMRKGEENGREHWFVDELLYQKHKDGDSIIAETKIGDYYYWTTEYQFKEYDNCIYVIDPKGIEYLKSKMGKGNENMFVIYVDVDEDERRRRGMMRGDDEGVWEKRNRDEEEEFLNFKEWDVKWNDVFKKDTRWKCLMKHVDK